MNCLILPLVVTSLSIFIGILLLLNSYTLKAGEIFLCIGGGGIVYFMLYHLLTYLKNKMKKPNPISIEFYRFPSRNINMDAISMDSDVVLFDINTRSNETSNINQRSNSNINQRSNSNINQRSNSNENANENSNKKVSFDLEERDVYKFAKPLEINQLRIPRKKIIDISDDISDDYDELMLELNTNSPNIISSNSSII
jgi:hypothetical protein